MEHFPGLTTLHILAEIQNMMTETQCEPEHFPGRFIFMSCTTTLYGEELCIATSQIVADYLRKFAHGHWSFVGITSKKWWCARKFAQGQWWFLGLGSEKKWYGTHTYKPDGEWDRVAEDMMVNFSESGHPVFKATLEENTSILHCRTKCCFRATSPSTPTTLEAPTIRARSFNLDFSGWQ